LKSFCEDNEFRVENLICHFRTGPEFVALASKWWSDYCEFAGSCLENFYQNCNLL